MAWLSRKISDKLGLSPGTLVYQGEKPNIQPRVTLVQYSPESYTTESSASWDTLKASVKTVSPHKWVHVEGLNNLRLIESVGSFFGVHQMTLEDIVNVHHRPKMSDFESYVHFVVKVVLVSQGEFRYEHFSIILGKDYILSFSEMRADFLKPIFERMENPQGRLRTYSSAYLAFALLDLIMDHYYLALSRLEAAVDEIETMILSRPSDTLLGTLYEVKRETALMRKRSAPVRDYVRSLLKNGSTLVGENFEVYYRDLEDHTVQIVDTCDAIKETLRNLLDVSDSYSTYNTNLMFKFFTGVSAIFLPLNFLASLYGMNFDFMPGLHHPAGFFVISAFMLSVGVLVAMFFRWRRWW